MKAISLWQPWATAMHLGIKVNETRSWWTGHRGELVICSSKRKMTEDDADTYFSLVAPSKDYLPPYGVALCVVNLDEVAPSDVFHTGRVRIGALEAALGNYTPGRWIWITKDRRPLKNHVPVNGHQGIFSLTPEEERLVREQL